MTEYSLLKAYRVHHELALKLGYSGTTALTKAMVDFTQSMIKIFGPGEDWDHETKIHYREILGEVHAGRHPLFTLGKYCERRAA